jgi:hypothetical protein
MRSWRYQKWRVVRAYIVEVDSQPQHVGQQIERGLHMVNTIFARPRLVAFHVYPVPDGDGPVLMPAHLPIRTRSLIEQQCPDRLGPRPQHGSGDLTNRPINPQVRIERGIPNKRKPALSIGSPNVTVSMPPKARASNAARYRCAPSRCKVSNRIEQHVYHHATASAMAKDIVLSTLHSTRRGRGRERGMPTATGRGFGPSVSPSSGSCAEK